MDKAMLKIGTRGFISLFQEGEIDSDFRTLINSSWQKYRHSAGRKYKGKNPHLHSHLLYDILL